MLISGRERCIVCAKEVRVRLVVAEAYRSLVTARCYASAVLAMALCLSVRLSVRHKSVFY